jgi:hypothetical protein
MSWPNDEVYSKAALALLIMEELHGDEETIRFLQQELVRRHVIKEHRAAHRALVAIAQRQATDASAETDRTVAALIAALEFYADQDNYKRRGNKPSDVSADGGFVAREALAKIANDSDADGEGGQ